jgi:hypothetical protein
MMPPLRRGNRPHCATRAPTKPLNSYVSIPFRGAFARFRLRSAAGCGTLAGARGQKAMTIPDWLFKVGSLAGLMTFCVAIVDRLFSTRPLVWISPGDYGRQVHCKNISTRDVSIIRIRCWPSGINVASGTGLNAIAAASIGDGFLAILKADQEREFPLLFGRSELLDEDCREVAPFVMIVSWRRNSSYWLPQIPKFIFSSARTMRALKSAK